MHNDRRTGNSRVIAVDDNVVAALTKARVGEDVVKAARAAGVMAHYTSMGWLVNGYRGSVMDARQERAFNKAIGFTTD